MVFLYCRHWNQVLGLLYGIYFLKKETLAVILVMIFGLLYYLTDHGTRVRNKVSIAINSHNAQYWVFLIQLTYHVL